MTYRLSHDPWVCKLPDTRFAIGNPASKDPLYLEYQAWLAAGNVPDPPDPAEAPPVPTEVSAAQGRLALLQAGVLDALEAWITAQPVATQIEYSSRGTWRRDWPLVATGATVLGLTEAQVDDLFVLAATL